MANIRVTVLIDAPRELADRFYPAKENDHAIR